MRQKDFIEEGQLSCEVIGALGEHFQPDNVNLRGIPISQKDFNEDLGTQIFEHAEEIADFFEVLEKLFDEKNILLNLSDCSVFLNVDPDMKRINYEQPFVVLRNFRDILQVSDDDKKALQEGKSDEILLYLYYSSFAGWLDMLREVIEAQGKSVKTII